VTNQDSLDVLWFAPFTGITSHAKFESSFIKHLEREGFRIHTLRCNGALQAWCTVMSSRDRGSESFGFEKKLSTCAECKNHRDLLTTFHSKSLMTLEDFLKPEDYEKAITLLENLTTDNWVEFEFDELPFGRFISYEVAVEFKTNDISRTPETWGRFRDLAFSSILAYFAAKNCLQHLKPKIVVTHSFEYAINRSFLAAFRKLGIPCYNVVHAGPFGENHLRYFRTYEADKFQFMIEDERFAESMKHPLSLKEVSLVNQHLAQLNFGLSIFSYSSNYQGVAEVDLLKSLALKSSQQNVLVVGSSPDEIEAANLALLTTRDNLMLTDYELIDVILENAKGMPEVNFIYRFHPRLVSNHRDSRESLHFERIKRKFENAPGNVSLNYPEQKIGLLDIAKLVNCCIATRSTAALQLMSLGCPVLFVDPQQNPFANFEKQFSQSRKLVFNNVKKFIESSRDSGWALDFSIQAFRYFASTTLRMCPPAFLHLSEGEQRKIKHSKHLLKILNRNLLIRKLQRFIPREVLKTLKFKANEHNWASMNLFNPPISYSEGSKSHKFYAKPLLQLANLKSLDPILMRFKIWETWLEIPKSEISLEFDAIRKVVNETRQRFGLNDL
jgi:hypothetical protein